MAKKLPKKQQQPLIISAFYIFIVLAFAAGLLAGFLLWGAQTQKAAPAAQQPQAQQPPAAQNSPAAGKQTPAATQQPRRYQVSADDDPAIGPKDAPVTIIEFSDYQCPFCRRWAEQVEKQIRQTYGDKVRLVYRDFPLTSLHPQALPAAEAANCAGEQGKYWDYHDKLFQQAHGLSTQAYQTYAQELGLDMEKFNACLKDHKYRDEIVADAQYAQKLGVRSTPTFFINGIPVVGAQPFSVFQSVIDDELAKAGGK